MPKDMSKDFWLREDIGARSLEEQWDWIRQKKHQSWPMHMRRRLLRGLEIEEPKQQAENVVLLGCWALFLMPLVVRNYFVLLRRLGIDYTYLEEERCCGILPMEASKGEDRERAEKASKEFMESNLEQVRRAGAKNAVYLCLWCAHLAKKLFPDYPIAQMHYPDILLDRLAKERLRVEPKVIGYYEGCHRRNKEWASGITLDWNGYREVLNNIEGLKVVKMPDHLCCVDIPDRIISAAEGLNVDTIVCSCFACHLRLRHVSNGRVRMQYYSDLLLQALSGY